MSSNSCVKFFGNPSLLLILRFVLIYACHAVVYLLPEALENDTDGRVIG